MVNYCAEYDLISGGLPTVQLCQEWSHTAVVTTPTSNNHPDKQFRVQILRGHPGSAGLTECGL